MTKTFRNTNGRGFQITFPNGITLSTQFGWGNYCENYEGSEKLALQEELTKTNWESNDAEIAIIGRHGEWLTKEFKDEGDDVLGRIKIDEWLKAFDFCRNYKP